MHWFNESAKSINLGLFDQARDYQTQLTKPPGSLGRLEELAQLLAAMQDRNTPRVDNIAIRIFAADHGVAKQGVSAFPQSVTAEMIKNFSRGGAAISVLARYLQADFRVINLGTADDVGELENVDNHKIAPGTRDFLSEEAMTEEQLLSAFLVGQAKVLELRKSNVELCIPGEMGIANTTSAAALAAVLLNENAADIVGRGSGVNDSVLQRKREVVAQAIKIHGLNENSDCWDVLRSLGGFEIAALTACYIACAQQGIPVLVDGFICSVAALLAVRINKSVRRWLIFSHRSAEAAHIKVLQSMGAKPLLELGMRLGEASGAAAAVPLLRMACALHNEMATFSNAGISTERD